MKWFLSLMIGLSLSTCLSQSEFKVYSNGLIYSDTTMTQLRHIVDSLNLKFLSCPLNKTYNSMVQGRAYYVKLDTGKIKHARRDMERGISLEAFKMKYPAAKISENEMMVVRFRYENYEGDEVIQFDPIITRNSIRIDKNIERFDRPLANTWAYRYQEKGEYTSEALYGFYFTTDMTSKPLPEEHSRLIQYACCMVDTNTSIYLESAGYTFGRDRDKGEKVMIFLNYVHRETHMPEFNYNVVLDSTGDTAPDTLSYEEYVQKMEEWDSLRFVTIEDKLMKTEEFQQLFQGALDEAQKTGFSSDEFEEYVGRYVGLSEALELKRGRRVMGMCSMDQSPRIHAMNIAILSAKTVHWETFLRAHLDIMNDNFSRASDGSYAWKARKTYIRELEELDINVQDLLLGIAYRVSNTSENHYFGTIPRLGRALSESCETESLESRLINFASDTTLDDFNRVIFYYLYGNYAYHLGDETLRDEKLEALKSVIPTFPEHIRYAILKED